MNWREFKPTIFFLLRFIGIYLLANLLYGFFVRAYEPESDPVTKEVTAQTAHLLSALGWPSHPVSYTDIPTVSIVYKDKSIVSVYEGCNGINVMIIFIAFLISFGPHDKKLYGFILAGVLLIHSFNLLRIGLLFFVSIYLSDYLYLTHKYFFTAFIYAGVLLLWLWWIIKVSKRKNESE
jgi:exosortase family protein XrtF